MIITRATKYSLIRRIYAPKSGPTKTAIRLKKAIESFNDSRPLCIHNVNASIDLDFWQYVRCGTKIDILDVVNNVNAEYRRPYGFSRNTNRFYN